MSLPASSTLNPGLSAALLCALLTHGAAWCAPAAKPVEASASMTEQQAADAIAAERREQRRLVDQVRADIEKMPVDDPRRAQTVRKLAAIEKRIADEDRSFSRHRYLSGGVEDPPVFQDYGLAMRRRIVERGTDHYPVQEGHRLHGRVVANLTIDAAGRLVTSEVVRGSGNPALDAQALAIAMAAAPFGTFTPAMREQADVIVYTASFNFQHENGALEGRAASAP